MIPLLFGRRRKGSSAAASPYLLQDLFTGTDGVALPSHTPDVDTVGGGWVRLAIVVADPTNTCAVVLNSNRAKMTNGASQGIVHVANVGDADVVVVADITWNTSAFPGIVVRSNALTLTDHRHWSILLGNTNKINIYEFSGSSTLRASTALTLVNGSTYTVTVTTSGNDITGVSGASSVTYNSAANNTNTRHGIRDGSGSAATTTYADNLTVTA